MREYVRTLYFDLRLSGTTGDGKRHRWRGSACKQADSNSSRRVSARAKIYYIRIYNNIIYYTASAVVVVVVVITVIV